MGNKEIQEIVFLKGEEYFAALLQDINLAVRQIDLETYIFDNCPLGQQIIEALLEAARRGVKIRIIVDGIGSPGWGNVIAPKLEAVGIESRVFHPIPWGLGQWWRMMIHLPYLFRVFYFIFKINKRNHRKVCIIDRGIVYIGSANISQCHLDTKKNGKNWRDTTLRLMQVDITDLEAAFEAAWFHKFPQDRIQTIFQRVNTQAVIRLNDNRHKRRALYKNLLRRLSKCVKRVWITNAYFVPDNYLLKKLQDLAQSGVDVRILLPQKADVSFITWASSTFYENLIKSGARIFEYMPSMLHAKTLILDDWFLVGSSNLNHRSLLHDLEVDVVVQTSSAKKRLELQFIEDLSLSKEIHLSTWYKRPWMQKWIGRLMLYLKYWI